MIKSQTIFKLSNNVLRRYENDWNGGTYFLYNILNHELWTGNFASKLFIDLIDGSTPINIIEKTVQNILKVDDINVLKDSINVVLHELLQKEIIYEV